MTPLIAACKDGRGKVVLQLVLHERDFDVNARDSSGRTALMHAVVRDHRHAVVHLVRDARVDINAADADDGTTPLMAAIASGALETVDLLVHDARTDVLARDKQDATAILYAARHGNTHAVQAILARAPAAIGAADAAGQTCLHAAAIGAADAAGRTCLHAAAESAPVDVVAAVLRGGAEVPSMFNELLNAKDRRGWTALRVALERGRADVARLLIACPGVDLRDEGRRAACLRAYWSAAEESCPQVLSDIACAAIGDLVGPDDADADTPGKAQDEAAAAAVPEPPSVVSVPPRWCRDSSIQDNKEGDVEGWRGVSGGEARAVLLAPWTAGCGAGLCVSCGVFTLLSVQCWCGRAWHFQCWAAHCACVAAAPPAGAACPSCFSSQ
ncbi:unnamed protein product [Pedinophyceae sp. YPF-701]|nr:unnamed protein product [Pedinophyceae sp. YPF-701]